MERTAWLGGNDNITGFIHFNHWLKLKRNMRRLWTGNNSIGMKILIRHKRKEEEITLVTRNVSITVTVTLVSRRKRSGQSPVCSIGVMFSCSAALTVQRDPTRQEPVIWTQTAGSLTAGRLSSLTSLVAESDPAAFIVCRYIWNKSVSLIWWLDI